MKNKKLTVTIIASVALVLTFILLTSYAYWRVQDTQTGTNEIQGACLSIELEEYQDDNNNLIQGFSLENAWPVTDEEGSDLKGYGFKVINSCEEDVTYQVILDYLETENPMNPEYVKIEINNSAIKKYSDLSDATIEGNGIISSKKVYTGIIPGREEDTNGEVTHRLKQWISDDSPNEEIGKGFKSKVRVVAGQKITESLRIMGVEGTPVATINNISVGDRLSYGSEEFYVIGIDGNNVKLLSRYLLNVGVIIPDDPLGIQNRYININTTYNGLMDFSDEKYWLNDDGEYIDGFTNNSFVYDERSNLKQYVDNYAIFLKKIGLNVTSGTIMSIQEVDDLCADSLIVNHNARFDCPDYIFGQSYWLGSVFSYGRIWRVSGDYIWANADTFSGIRPVINIILN